MWGHWDSNPDLKLTTGEGFFIAEAHPSIAGGSYTNQVVRISPLYYIPTNEGN
tara:strand:- start:105412 stop:105570 length:159 start_codon:yes stop_codon:yes gene_type:complete